MMTPQYKEKIDTWVEEHTQQMLEDLKTLIRIPSFRGEPAEGMPYGEMPAKAVRAMQELMEKYGLRTTNYDNYCVTGDLEGEEEKTLDILAHLDVVPVSDRWTKTAPFEPLIEGNRIYGRGSSDDKGPAIAALYAMRCVNELALGLKKGVRLICGSDEECGSGDMKYYYGKEEEALYTFSPDADYPLINIEKGRLGRSFSAQGSLAETDPDDSKRVDNCGSQTGNISKLKNNISKQKGDSSIHVRRISAGHTTNIVPGEGTLVLSCIPEEKLRPASDAAAQATGGTFTWEKKGDETVVTAKGCSAHASSPELGINSITMILELIAGLGMEEDPGAEMLLGLRRLWPHGDVRGESLGIACRDEVSGELTMSLDILNYEVSEDGSSFRISGYFDCRAPICCDDGKYAQVIRQRLKEEGFELQEGEVIGSHYVSADSELVKKLLESYELYFGKKGEPFAIGGGTYVHELKRGVAFGCAVPEVDNRMHGDDEFMEISMLVRSTKIMADAIMRLCGKV